jgi:DNA-binding CsgD family transcriptional regulator
VVGGKAPISPGGAGEARLAARAPPRQQKLIAELVQLLACGDPPAEEVLECGAQGLAALLGDSCVASLLSDDGRWLHPLGVADPDPEAVVVLERLIGGRLRADRGFAKQVVTTGRAVRLASTSPEVVRGSRPELGAFVEQFGVHSLVVAPMRSRGRVIGHVALLRRREQMPLTATEEALVQTVADLLGVGVESASSPSTKLRGPVPGSADGTELSAREREIVMLLASGYTNREIAERLVLSIRTVEWHRARIQWKLGVSGRAALVGRARVLGLIE